MTYTPAADRYEKPPIRRCGRSGLQAARRSRWGSGTTSAAWTRSRTGAPSCAAPSTAGVTHLDLANNYGPPPGSAEEAIGPHPGPRPRGRTATSWSSPRRPATSCGPGPTASGARASTCSSSLDQSLKRMGLEYVDIFYSHRPDPETPLEETMAALDQAVRQGKALYAGISNYPADRTARGRGDPAAPRHALPHPPAPLLDVRPLDRGRPHRRPRARGHRLHRLLAARPGPPHRQVPRRHPEGLPRLDSPRLPAARARDAGRRSSRPGS